MNKSTFIALCYSTDPEARMSLEGPVYCFGPSQARVIARKLNILNFSVVTIEKSGSFAYGPITRCSELYKY